MNENWWPCEECGQEITPRWIVRYERDGWGALHPVLEGHCPQCGGLLHGEGYDWEDMEYLETFVDEWVEELPTLLRPIDDEDGTQ